MIESMQYNAVTTITGAIRGTSSKNCYQELGLESLRSEHDSKNFTYSIKYMIINHLLICLI